MFIRSIFIVTWFLSILYTPTIHAQKEPEIQHVKIAINKISNASPEANYFRKATACFLTEDWDSTLIYAFKELGRKDQSAGIKDWCNYFRGVSFKKKQVFGAADQSFRKISEGFQFKHLVQIHLGGIALEKGKYRAAITHFKQAERLTSSSDNDYSKSGLLQNIGLCYLHLQSYNTAEKYLQKSTQLQEQEGNTAVLVSSYMNLANLYYAQYQDEKAIPYFEKAYQLSKKTKNFELKQNAALNMSVVEENRQNPLEALTFRKEYETWRDSLNNQNKVWALAEAEKEFALGQKQEQIHLLQVENQLKKTQRNASLISIAFLILLIGVGVYFLWQQAKSKRIILAQKLHLDELNLTKDKLFSVVSHDLRSSVNALKSSNGKLFKSLDSNNLTELKGLLKTNSSITNGVYSLLDNLLNWAMIQTRQLYFQREPLHLSSVVEQVMINYAPVIAHKKMVAECDVQPGIMIDADLDSMKVVLRNLFDNAIKFSNENGVLRVYSSAETANHCELVVEDAGEGMSERTLQALQKNRVILPNERESDRAGTGLGLQLCKEMMEKNKGTIQIESKEGVGTRIRLQLPKTQEEWNR